jgi:hypothetical protein
MSTEISSNADVIDTRDVIARVEELETEIEEYRDAGDTAAAEELEVELKPLADLLDELAGRGGDEEWRGVWYPVTLVRDSYFTEYAEELARDIGAVNDAATWPNSCIDWERAAQELKADYATVEYEGVTYWYR